MIEWCRGIVEWHHDGLITRRSVVRIGLPQQQRGPVGAAFFFEGPLVTALPAEVDRCVAYKDPERQKAYALEWLKRYPEKAREAAKRWNRGHPEARRAQHRKDRAKRARVAGSFTLIEWSALVRSYAGRCGYCGTDVGKLHADHRTPLSRGGRNEISNIIPACAPCNLRKARSTEREFRVRLANERLRSSEFEVVDWWVVTEIQSVN